MWQAYGKMLGAVEAMDNVRLLGVMDDDRLVVGQSDGAPWTFYMMADVADFDTAGWPSAICIARRLSAKVQPGGAMARSKRVGAAR